MILWKRSTQYASTFGKLSSGRRTGKGQFSFQSQRKAMPKKAQTTAQLHSSNMLVKQWSKFSKPGFSSMWTVNFQMFKLDLEKAKEPEIKLTTPNGWLKKTVPEKYLLLLYWLCQSLWLCGSQQTVENSERDGNTRPPDHCWVFQICWHIECSTFTASSFRIWNSSIGIPSPPLALFIVMLPKAHLTSHSRMSGSRWVITPLWLSESYESSW